MKTVILWIIFCSKIFIATSKPCSTPALFSAAKLIQITDLTSQNRFISYPVYLLVRHRGQGGEWKGCTLTTNPIEISEKRDDIGSEGTIGINLEVADENENENEIIVDTISGNEGVSGNTMRIMMISVLLITILVNIIAGSPIRNPLLEPYLPWVFPWDRPIDFIDTGNTEQWPIENN